MHRGREPVVDRQEEGVAEPEPERPVHRRLRAHERKSVARPRARPRPATPPPREPRVSERGGDVHAVLAPAPPGPGRPAQAPQAQVVIAAPPRPSRVAQEPRLEHSRRQRAGAAGLRVA